MSGTHVGRPAGDVGEPGDDPLLGRQGISLGRFIAEEHSTLVRAPAVADLAEEARTLLGSAGTTARRALGDATRDVRELAGRAAERLGQVS